jgi:hypothetical protein
VGKKVNRTPGVRYRDAYSSGNDAPGKRRLIRRAAIELQHRCLVGRSGRAEQQSDVKPALRRSLHDADDAHRQNDHNGRLHLEVVLS